MFGSRDARFDTAQVCVNGHVLTSSVELSPERVAARCSQCGAGTTSKCSACGTAIRGYHSSPGVISLSPYELPSHCHECGTPYPWTAARIAALEELIELSDLEQGDKDQMKREVDALVVESPRTRVAAARMAAFLRRAGVAYTVPLSGALREMACPVAREAMGLDAAPTEASSKKRRG